MNTVKIALALELPEELAQEAQSLGLFTDEEMATALRKAIQRKQAGERLLAMMAELHGEGGKAPSLEEIDEEVRAYRRKRREMKNYCDGQ